MFESFVRLQLPGRPSVAGTGIGLAVVRELALSMGGSATAEAAPGGGARMVVALPAAAAGAVAAGAVAAGARQAAAPAGGRSP